MSPSSYFYNFLLSKNSRDVLPYHILTPFSSKCLVFVSPLMKNNNSSIIPFKNIFLVVNNGIYESLIINFNF